MAETAGANHHLYSFLGHPGRLCFPISLAFRYDILTEFWWIGCVCVGGCILAYLVLLHLQILHFLPIEGLWQPCVQQVYWQHFDYSICSYLLRWCVISDRQCCYYNCFGVPKTVRKMVNVIDKWYMCSYWTSQVH